jgi:hypothetical protein
MNLERRNNFRKVMINMLDKRGEIWAFHPNYVNILVSSLGKVKNYLTGREFSIRITRQGYRYCSIPLFQTIGVKKTQSKLIHRMVAETFFDYLPVELYEANHMNGDKSNNSIHNINWLTRKENLQHARDNGLFKKQIGPDNGMYKYTNEDIKALDELRKEGYTLKQLGFLIDLKEGSVWSLLNRRKYE